MLLATIALYFLGRWLYLRSGLNPFLIPVLSVVIVIVALLLLFNIPYAQYAQSTKGMQLLIGPATVAMAVPLYMHLHILKRIWLPIVTALIVGGVTAVVSASLIAWVFGGSWEIIASVAPKSATMPVSMPSSVAIGGVASLAAIATAITGIAGVLMAGVLFKLTKTDDPVVQGFTLGLIAHAIGTARVIQVSHAAAAMAALAMGLNALLTAFLIPFLPIFFID